MNRLTGRGRGQGGFTLVDLIVAAAVTALLSGAIFGGVAVVLKVSPASSSSVVSGQATRNLQNIQLVVTEGVLREDWRQASIIKVDPLDPDSRPNFFSNDTGLDCNFGVTAAALTTGAAVGSYANEGPVVSLQRPAPQGQDGVFPTSVVGLAKGGMVRGSYVIVGRVAAGQPVLRSDGSRVKDLVRRECAVQRPTPGSPALREATGAQNTGCGPVGAVVTDCSGWRYQPGAFDAGFTGTADVPWTPAEKTLLQDIRSITSSSSCNQSTRGSTTDAPYARCNVTLTVTFGDSRTHQIRLYQGLGF